MTVTFLTTLDLDAADPESLEIEASNMETALAGAGFPVVSIVHWQRPTNPVVPALSVEPPKDKL